MPWLHSRQGKAPPENWMHLKGYNEKRDASHQTIGVRMDWLRSRQKQVEPNEWMRVAKPLEFPCVGCIHTIKAGCSNGAVRESLTPSSYDSLLEKQVA